MRKAVDGKSAAGIVVFFNNDFIGAGYSAGGAYQLAKAAPAAIIDMNHFYPMIKDNQSAATAYRDAKPASLADFFFNYRSSIHRFFSGHNLMIYLKIIICMRHFSHLIHAGNTFQAIFIGDDNTATFQANQALFLQIFQGTPDHFTGGADEGSHLLLR